MKWVTLGRAAPLYLSHTATREAGRELTLVGEYASCSLAQLLADHRAQ